MQKQGLIKVRCYPFERLNFERGSSIYSYFLKQDKKATAHPAVLDKLKDGVNDAQVVIDGKLITSQGLATATQFALAIVSKLFGHARARSVAEGLVYQYPRS